MDSHQRIRARRELQGPRPAPLKLNKESHKVRKPELQVPNRTIQPVIIYTQSPKIIHIEARNFMNLVQRLTGSSSSSTTDIVTSDDHHNYTAAGAGAVSSSCSTDYNSGGGRSCDVKTSWSSAAFDVDDEKKEQVNYETVQSEELANGDAARLRSPAPAFSPFPPNFLLPSPRLRSPSIFQDLPLFTPNFDSFFYSPGHFYRLSEPIFTPQRPPPLNAASVISPSPTALDLCKNLPEY